LKTNNIEELSALYISLWNAQNNMGLFLIRQQFLNAYENAYTMQNIEPSNVYKIENYRDISFTPYWMLFDEDITKKSSKVLDRSHILSYEPILPDKSDYDFTDILSMPQYTIINEFCMKFDTLRKTFDTKELSQKLKLFLDDFHYKCRSMAAANDVTLTNIASKINATYLRQNNIIDHSNKLIEKMILTDKLPQLINIYSSFYKEFYQNLIDLRFLEIIEKLHTIEPDKTKMINVIKTCGLILKEIQLLDTFLIYDFDKEEVGFGVNIHSKDKVFLREPKIKVKF
jgi:hypothetical protein